MAHLVLCTVNQEVIGMDTILVTQMGIEFVYLDGVAPIAIFLSAKQAVIQIMGFAINLRSADVSVVGKELFAMSARRSHNVFMVHAPPHGNAIVCRGGVVFIVIKT